MTAVYKEEQSFMSIRLGMISLGCAKNLVDSEHMLAQLQEAFYYYKTEALDFYTDDELIEYMVCVFNGRAQGSAEYLIETSLDALCRYARDGYDARNADKAGDLF